MLKIIIAIAFLCGFVLGFGLNLVLTLLFWLTVGTGIALLVDLAMGLGERACAFRVWRRSWFNRIFRRTPEPVVRSTIWVNI